MGCPVVGLWYRAHLHFSRGVITHRIVGDRLGVISVTIFVQQPRLEHYPPAEKVDNLQPVKLFTDILPFRPIHFSLAESLRGVIRKLVSKHGRNALGRGTPARAELIM